MTPKEIDALPQGPIERIERPITMADIEAGRMGRVIVELRAHPAKYRGYKADDPICYRDSAGHLWLVGEWADGRKFKEPFGPI